MGLQRADPHRAQVPDDHVQVDAHRDHGPRPVAVLQRADRRHVHGRGGETIGVQFDDPETAQAIYVALGLDVIDEQTGRQFRYVVPRAKVSDRDNIEDKADSLHQYGLTFTAMVPTTGGTPVKRFVSSVPLPT